jgi:hypothetical protein
MNDQKKEETKQLGDFIWGRLLFVEHLCRERGLDKDKTMEAIREEAMRLARTPERRAILDQRMFKGVVLSTSLLPDWLDKVLLEATSYVLKGADAPLYSNSSEQSCIPFEAGRYNAHRQADSVFKVMFAKKSPEEWLTRSFRVLHQKCYGDVILESLRIEQMEERAFRISMDNRRLEKGSPLDCSTILGYLYGALEKLGARNIRIQHRECSTLPGSPFPSCVFEVSWQIG